MRVPRTAMSASAVDGTIYVIGGFEVPVRPISTVEAYQAAPSGFAYGPNPADGAMHPDTGVNLSWGPGDFAVSHNVYLGDSFADVNDGLGDTFGGNQASTFISAGFAGSHCPDGLVRGTGMPPNILSSKHILSTILNHSICLFGNILYVSCRHQFFSPQCASRSNL